MSLAECVRMCDEEPQIVYQLWWDMELVASREEPAAGWMLPGESAAQARDRLRAERAALRERAPS